MQELKETRQYENIRIATGVSVPVNDHDPQVVLKYAYDVAIPQLGYRMDQVFRRNEKTDTFRGKDKAPTGTLVFAGVSRLVSTGSFENLRVEGELALEVEDGETFQDAYDRAFQGVGEQINAAVARATGGSSEQGGAREDGKTAKNFDWAD